MIDAMILICAMNRPACATDDARSIGSAVNSATEDDTRRAHLVVAAWYESGFQLSPKPQSWDAKAGLAKGPWQLWNGGTLPLPAQAKQWLWLLDHQGLAGICGGGQAGARVARKRESAAAKLLASVAP